MRGLGVLLAVGFTQSRPALPAPFTARDAARGLRAGLREQGAFVWAALSCFSVYNKRNTGTDKDIGRERGPVLLALTLELVGNWISVLDNIPSSEAVLLQLEVKEKTTAAFWGEKW